MVRGFDGNNGLRRWQWYYFVHVLICVVFIKIFQFPLSVQVVIKINNKNVQKVKKN